MTDYKVVSWMETAEDDVFRRMMDAGYDRVTGYEELRGYPDWQESWQNWWDGGEY